MTHYGNYFTQFGHLRDVAIGPNHEIVIVDNDNQCVVVLDCKLNLQTVIGKESGHGTLTDPCCVAVNNDIIAVSDQKNSHQVKKYTLQGEFISAIGHYGSQTGEFDYPRGLTFNNKNLYVIDGFNCRVQVFQQDDQFSFTFGTNGSGPGEFLSPIRIANDSSNNVFVSDYYYNCITQFSCTGEFIRRIFCIRPWAVTVTPDKYMITSHDLLENEKEIRIWDPSYQLINEFGTKGGLPENYCDIRGIKMDSSGNIFMVDHILRQLKIFYNN